MSNGKNRMDYATDHTDGLTTSNSSDATLTAHHFWFLPCAFLQQELKPLLKSRVDMPKGQISQCRHSGKKKIKKEIFQNHKAYFKS